MRNHISVSSVFGRTESSVARVVRVLSALLIGLVATQTHALAVLTVYTAGDKVINEGSPVWTVFSGSAFYYYAFPNLTGNDGQSTDTEASPQVQPVGNNFLMPLVSSSHNNSGWAYAPGSSKSAPIYKYCYPNNTPSWPGPVYNFNTSTHMSYATVPPTCPYDYMGIVDDSAMYSGMKGFYFVGTFSGSAIINPTYPTTQASAAVFFHQQNSFASGYEYGFAYYFTNPVNSAHPFVFYWDDAANCGGLGFCQTGTTWSTNTANWVFEHYETSSDSGAPAPIPNPATTQNSLGQYTWGFSVYFTSNGQSFRVQMWDPNNLAVKYDEIITPPSSQYTMSVVNGYNGTIQGSTGAVTLNFQNPGQATDGSVAPSMNIQALKAGK
jgi:hypothetical protein